MPDTLKPTGERQIGSTLDDIRADHRARYEWVAERIDAAAAVLDAGCGTGYGSGILAGRCRSVLGVDSDSPTIDFARKTWGCDNLRFETGNLHFLDLPCDVGFDCVVAFEVIEHLLNPGLFFDRVWAQMKDGAALYISSPNEGSIAHTVELNPYHIRHYTAAALAETVAESGFGVEETFQQETGPISEGSNARTLILSCVRLATRPDDRAAPDAMADLRATLSHAEREMVLRSNAVRKLQGEVRRAGNASEDMLRRIDARFEPLRVAISARDDELVRLRSSEALAVIELRDAERERAANAAAHAGAERRLRQSEDVRNLLRQRLNEANIVLQVQTAEVMKTQQKCAELAVERKRLSGLAAKRQGLLKARTARLAAVEGKCAKFKASQLRRVSFFDPGRPTVMSILRVMMRYRFFIGILAKAPFYSLVNARNAVAQKRRSSR